VYEIKRLDTNIFGNFDVRRPSRAAD